MKIIDATDFEALAEIEPNTMISAVKVMDTDPAPVIRYQAADGTVHSVKMEWTADGWAATIPAGAALVLPSTFSDDCETSLTIGTIP